MAVWIALGAVAMGLLAMTIAIYAAQQKKNKDGGDAR